MKKGSRSLIRPGLEKFKPYEPGKPMALVKRELGLEEAVKLASNESPYPPFPEAQAAMAQAVKYVNRYPDGNCTFLKEKLAEHLKQPKELLMLGNGSNELLRLIAEVVLEPENNAVMASPSFIVYSMVTRLVGAEPIEVPLDTDHRHDLKSMIDAVTDQTKIVFICNPNNPTGTIISNAELDEFLDEVPDHVLVVLDEAYAELVGASDYPDGSRYVDGTRPIVVLRTFSKVYGLAGCRVGYGAGPAFLVEAVNKAREPFNVNTVAQIGALFSLGCQDQVNERQRLNIEGKNFLYEELGRLSLDYIPSEANFLMIKLNMNGREAADKLLNRGLIVRPGDIFGYPDHIRVTIGTPEENKRFVAVLESLIGG